MYDVAERSSGIDLWAHSDLEREPRVSGGGRNQAERSGQGSRSQASTTTDSLRTDNILYLTHIVCVCVCVFYTLKECILYAVQSSGDPEGAVSFIQPSMVRRRRPGGPNPLKVEHGSLSVPPTGNAVPGTTTVERDAIYYRRCRKEIKPVACRGVLQGKQSVLKLYLGYVLTHLGPKLMLLTLAALHDTTLS
uniref:Uncharacterized protein n=1 Tax=Timema shepardi TaxID=629360 RepID=A0A7R9G414_TIMSH|nr:unnamed protein product [Timema shepardi]